MLGSMGQVGSAGDNAAMESFFSLLQKILDLRLGERAPYGPIEFFTGASAPAQE